MNTSPRMAAFRRRLSKTFRTGGFNKKDRERASGEGEFAGSIQSPNGSQGATSPNSSPLASPNNSPPVSPKQSPKAEHTRTPELTSEALSPLNVGFNKSIRPTLDVIDRIRPILKEQGIELPSIVVVGDQSSGKSSVIERLSCVNLPRGSGIVTRCPLVLRLVREERVEPYAILSYTAPDTREKVEVTLKRLDQVSAAVQEATVALAGTSKGVVKSPIYLKVHSPLVPDLTLIDLPGITRIPVGGQPKDIERVIKEMIIEYIRPEEAVILCVIPAMVDFSTCECIGMAKEVDPHGKRVLGVVTKIDQAPKGIRAKLEAQGEENVKLDLGFIAVRNKDSTEPAEAEMTPAQLNRLEMEYFRTHPELSSMPTGYLGTEELVRRLMDIQMQRIQRTLPGIKDKVQQHIQALRKDLKQMKPKCSNEPEAHVVFTSKASKLQQLFSAIKDAHYDVLVDDDDNPRLHVPARLYAMFLDYRDTLKSKVPDFLSESYYQTIKERVEEARGHSLANFMSHPVFARCYREGVAIQLMAPSIELVETVREYVEDVLYILVGKIFKDIPRLSGVVKEFIRDLLYANEEHVRRLVEDLVLQEEKVFTLNSSYMDLVNAVKIEIQNLRAGGKGDEEEEVQVNRAVLAHVPAAFINRCVAAKTNEERDMLEMQLSLSAYTKIVLDNIADSIPKALILYFVQKLSQTIVPDLERMIQDKGPLLDYFVDDATVVSKRRAKESQLRTLEEAWRELKSV